jgi:asparagine synthase (glutamine-hydrolysing)
MCGIAGIWDFRQTLPMSELKGIAGQMAVALKVRGPDGHGVVAEKSSGLVFAHRRLSVIDLSEKGSQPMASSCGRMLLTYNGELYNTPALRGELMRAGRRFQGHSDSEVLVEGLAEYGVEKFVRKIDGMFAFAVFDKQEKILWLVRDRLGVKPLYYGTVNGFLIFGSDIHALKVFPKWAKTLNMSAIGAFLQNNYIPAPLSIFEGIYKLEPSVIARFDINGQSRLSNYWSLKEVVRNAKKAPFLDVCHAEEVVSSALADAVQRQMVSDVPIGAFLSGGIDSSLLVALMQKASARPIDTFSIGFDDKKFDESTYARNIANYLGTTHHELLLTGSDVREVIPLIPEIFSEPFSDSSQLPTHILAKFARGSVKVALSGDGADELFAGYNRYSSIYSLTSRLERVPSKIRMLLAGAILKMPRSFLNFIETITPSSICPMGAVPRGIAVCEALLAGEKSIYSILHGHWPDLGSIMPRWSEKWDMNCGLPSGHISPLSKDNLIESWQYMDMLRYLPDDILVKVDRTSMAASLEVRVPFLDHGLIEESWRVPLEMKVRGSTNKWLLRQILAKHVPIPYFDRPKKGFGIPIDRWLRQELREWVEDTINPSAIKKYGILDAEVVWHAWVRHRAGHVDLGYWLWDVLMLQTWLEAHA